MPALNRKPIVNNIFVFLILILFLVFIITSCKTSVKKKQGIDLVAIAEKTKPERAVSEADLPKSENEKEAGTDLAFLDDYVLARVDGEPITNEEVLNAAKSRLGNDRWNSLTKKEKEKAFAAAFQGIVARKLILAEAKTEGYGISDDRIISLIKSQIPEINQKFGGSVPKYVESNNLNYDKFIQTFKDDMIYEAYVKNKIMPKDNIFPEEIRKYYEENKSQYYQEAAAHLYAITLYKKGNEEENAFVREKAGEILARIEKGEEFEALAKEFSEDNEKRDKGGDWGWVSKNSFAAPELNEAAFNLKPGENSGIIETTVAYWIIKVTGIKTESTKQLSEVWKEIETAIKKERINRAMAIALDKLQKKHKIIFHNIAVPN